MVVRSHEVVEDRAPLLQTLGVPGPLAREHQRAADVRERLEGRRLAARCRCHRLVEPGEAPVDLSLRHLGEPELRQRSQLEVGIGGGERDVESGGRELGRGACVARALGARQVEPALFGSRRDVAEEPFGPREPAACCRGVAEHQSVLAGEPERDPRRACELAVTAESCVRALPVDDRPALVPEPPERPAEPVQRLGRVAQVEHFLERIACGAPPPRRQRLVSASDRVLRGSRRHDAIVAPRHGDCECPVVASGRAAKGDDAQRRRRPVDAGRAAS